jgi:hypothetical protein
MSAHRFTAQQLKDRLKLERAGEPFGRPGGLPPTRSARAGGRQLGRRRRRPFAEEVFLSVEAVKAHLRTLFDRFGVADLPQNQKRLKLAENALRSGSVSPSELRS